MNKFNMEVSKKLNGAYVAVGVITVSYPTLADLGILTAEVKETDSEGFPVYADEKMQYAFDAVLAAVKAAARNKLVSGTINVKDGCKIAESVEELLEGGGGNRGDALAAAREFLAAFKEWLKTIGKSDKVQGNIYELARSKGLALQPATTREKFSGYLATFAESLNETQANRFSRPLLALSEACEGDDCDLG